MVSSFSNPGFPPVHTHPPTFSAMVAEHEDSLRETLDALFAPYLAKIRRARELALSADGDSTPTPMFAISNGGVSDPAPMISDDAAGIDPGQKIIPRVAASTDHVPPLLSSSSLLQALANPPVRPPSNSTASLANSPSQPLHSNDIVAAIIPLQNVEKTRPVAMVTTKPLFPISATFSTESAHAHNHNPVLSTKEATTMAHVMGFPLKNAGATKFVGLSHTNTTKHRHEVLGSLIHNLSHGKAKWHWFLNCLLACYTDGKLGTNDVYLNEINGWVSMYAVGKLVMVLNAEKVFDEIAKRQSEDNAGNPFDRMTPLFHSMVVCSQFCITEGEFWNVWDPGGRLAKILGVMLCSKHQENHCEKSFIDISLLIKDQLHEVDFLDFTAGRSEEEALKVMHEFSSALDGYVLRYLDFSDNALDKNGVNAFGSLLSSQNNLEELYLMNMARLHMCHNTREWHCDVIRKIKWLYEKGISIMIDTQGQGHYEDFSDYIKNGDELTFKLLLYFQAVNAKGFGITKFGSTEEAKKVVGNMNDVAASAIKIKEMEQGLTSLIVLGSGRLSDLIAQLQDILEGVNEADILPGKFDSAVIRAQIQQLAREFWVLTSSGPITIYNESSSSSGNYASYLVLVVALAAMGYRFHDFIFTILVSDAGFVKIDSLALRVFDERSHSADCDFQLGYHMLISDTGGTLRGLLTSNVQTKDAHKSKFLICIGKFMKNGTIVHLKLGFHEFILDKGGTTIQRLLNSKSTEKVEIILVQENAYAQLFDALQPLEEVDILIVPADQTRIAPNVFDEISDSSCCVVVQCAMCYCKGIRDKGGGSKFWYTVISNRHFSCLNGSGNSIECSQDGMIGVVMLVAYTTCIDVGGVCCSTYIALSREGILEGGKGIYTTTFISGFLTGRRMMTMTDLGILKHFLSEYVEQRKLGAAFTVAKHIPKLGDLSLLIENTSVEQLGLVRKVTIFTDSTTIIGDAASKDGLQVLGGSPFDITSRNHFLKKQLQGLQIGACYAEASN